MEWNIPSLIKCGSMDRRTPSMLTMLWSLLSGSINRHISFIWPCTFSNIWGVTINWINTQFWSTSWGTFDKTTPIAYTFVGVSFNWIVNFSMHWGVTINWYMSSNWNQRVTAKLYSWLVWTQKKYANLQF